MDWATCESIEASRRSALAKLKWEYGLDHPTDGNGRKNNTGQIHGDDCSSQSDKKFDSTAILWVCMLSDIEPPRCD